MTDLPPAAPRVETRVAFVLRGGVTLAAVLLLIGLPWNLVAAWSDGASQPSVGETLRQLPEWHPATFSALGVAVLVATPVLQLLTSAVLFWRRRDHLFVALTLLVCAIVAVGVSVSALGE